MHFSWASMVITLTWFLYDGFYHCSIFSSWTLHWFIILLPWLWLSKSSGVPSEHAPCAEVLLATLPLGNADITKSSFKDLKPSCCCCCHVLVWRCCLLERQVIVFGYLYLFELGSPSLKEFPLWGVIQRLLPKSLVKAHSVLMTGNVKAPWTLVNGYCAFPEGPGANSYFIYLFTITLFK